MWQMVTRRTSLDVAAIGRRLAQRRDDLRLDQEGVAEKAGVSRAYISRLERGIVPNPKVTELAQVAEALDLTLAELISPEPEIVESVYSHVFEEAKRQVAHLPPKQAERIIRGLQNSIEIAEASEVVRRN